MIYLVDNSSDPRIPKSYCKVTTIDEVVKYCEDKPVLGIDTETEGFDFTCKKMIMFQIGDENNQYVIDTRVVDIEPLRHILEHRDIVKIFHNAKFDYKFIKRWANIECEGIYDTFLTERVLNCGRDGVKYGLKDVCKKYLNVELNKEVRNQFIGLTGQPFREDQIVYGAKDVEYLLGVRKHQLPLIDKYKLNNVVDLENKAVTAFADIEYNGLDLDSEKWKEIEAVNMDKADKLESDLDEMLRNDHRVRHFVSKYIQTDMFTPVEEIRDVDVKWTSPKQVLDVFKCIVPKL